MSSLSILIQCQALTEKDNKEMNTVKYLLRVICGTFCCIMAIGGFFLSLTEKPAIPYIIETIIFVVLTFLLSREPKDKNNITNQVQIKSEPLQRTVVNAKSNFISNYNNQELLNSYVAQANHALTTGNIFKVTVQRSDSPPLEASTTMKQCYSSIQLQDDLRILKDSVTLLRNTTNLETFFNRYELAMKTTYVVDQAKNAGILIENPFPADYLLELKGRSEDVLRISYEKELKKIVSLKTANGKRNRIDRFINNLSEYQDEFEFSYLYKNIIDNLNQIKKEL